ncbi:MAG: AMP-binding protein, partial [Actinomycetota bacterium]|nr:AMP-binding protein [Actinomycetota bacterium]
MPGAIADGVHLAGTLVRAGLLRPGRPDRSLRALVALHRWGPTLPASYTAAAARYPDAAAIVDELGTLTFAQVERRTNAIARGLAGSGVREGDGVAIMCRNHRWFVEASIACAKLGANLIYLNTSFAGPQVADVVAREAARAVIFDAEFASAVRAGIGSRTGFVAWTEEDEGTGWPSLQELAASRIEEPLPPPAEPGRTVILTSGTTGTPKGANRASPDSLAPAAALLAATPLRAG